MKPARIPLSRKWDIAQRMLSALRGPHVASLFITRQCNLRCPYCRAVNQSYLDADGETWRRIIDRLHGFGVRMFTITGGEPFLRDDMFDIIGHITRDRRSVCWMISNGRLCTPALIDRCADVGLQFLTVSLDSLDRRGVKSDGAVLELLMYARRKGIICSTLTVVTRENLDEIPVLLAEVTKRNIMFDMGLFQHVGGEFSPDDAALKPDDYAKLAGVMRILRAYKRRTGLVSPSMGYLSENLEHYRRLDWKCRGDRDGFLIVNNDGTLMACQEWGGGPAVTDLASLRDPQWREYRRKAVSACPGCYYGCYYQYENKRVTDLLFDVWCLVKA
jgi:MoaA/NifB/PqqE/SkfB family radical SAM enzyme